MSNSLKYTVTDHENDIAWNSRLKKKRIMNAIKPFIAAVLVLLVESIIYYMLNIIN